MAKVTTIRRNQHNPNRCSVFVDDEFVCSCDLDVATAMNLRKGLELTAELERELRALDRRMVLKQKVWRFVSYKPRTVAQTEDKLTAIGCSDEERAEIIEWLKELNQLNDESYAQNFVQVSKERKPLSPVELRRRLTAKGISKDLVSESIHSTISEQDILDGAIRVAKKKLNALAKADGKTQREKLHRFLRMRGYTWEVIRSTLSSLGLMVMLFLLPIAMHSALATGIVVGTADSVGVTIRIIDAITDRPLQNSMVALHQITEGGATTISGADNQQVVNGEYKTTLFEKDRVEIIIHANGYFQHRQVISVRSLDSSTAVKLTARLYPQDSAIAQVYFDRGTDTLDIAWASVMNRIGRELSAQTFNIDVKGWIPARATEADSLLVAQRIDRITQYLVGKGVEMKRILSVVAVLPETLPIPLYINEHPQSQFITIIPRK